MPGRRAGINAHGELYTHTHTHTFTHTHTHTHTHVVGSLNPHATFMQGRELIASGRSR